MRFVSRAQREGVDQMEGSKWRRRSCRIGVLSAAVLAFGLAVVACGGPSTPGVATGSTTTTRSGGDSTGGGSPARGALAYASCMRSHGVTGFPDPNASGLFTELKNETLQQLGVTSSQLRAADHLCVPRDKAGTLSRSNSNRTTSRGPRACVHTASPTSPTRSSPTAG
jgi:hypothetical protein